jgi:hypothetical protein
MQLLFNKQGKGNPSMGTLFGQWYLHNPYMQTIIPSFMQSNDRGCNLLFNKQGQGNPSMGTLFGQWYWHDPCQHWIETFSNSAANHLSKVSGCLPT